MSLLLYFGSPVSPSSGAVVGTVRLGGSPKSYGIEYDGVNLWATAFDVPGISRVDPISLAQDRILMGQISKSVGVRFDGANLWVCGGGSSGSAWKINPTTGALLATVTVGTNPFGVQVFGARVFISNFGDGTVTVIDIASAAVVAILAVGNGPLGMCSDGSNVWVANYADGTISRIDPVALSVTATVGLDAEGGPIDVAFDGTNLRVTEGLISHLAIVSPSLLAVTNRVGILSAPRTVLYDGLSLWVPENTNSDTGFLPVVATNPGPGGGVSNEAELQLQGSDFAPSPY